MSYFEPVKEDLIRELSELIDTYGTVLEKDHPYVYTCHYPGAFEELEKLLYEYGHVGNLDFHGDSSFGLAVYCIYNADEVEYEEAKVVLKQEGERQFNEANR